MNKYFNENSIVLVTGASSGIGKCLASRLITKYGAKVIGTGRNQEKLNSVATELGDKFTPYPFDAGNENGWIEFKNYLINNGIKLTGVINSAGVLPPFKSFDETIDYHSVINVNYLSLIYSAKHLLPVLKESDFPIMINVSSSSALCPFAGVSIYSSTKAAAERFTECLAVENKRVLISTVMPGFTKTDVMRSQNLNEKETGIINKISANPEKVAKKILNKASKKKRRIITGIDAHFMNFLFKFFPRSAPKIITWFLRKTKMELFKEL